VTQPSTVLIQDSLQQEAIALCCDTDKRVVGVTGQAGTGKTTIMQQGHEQLHAAGHRVVLCAPTGKAAKRISEATGIPAITIHRLLEFTHPGDPDPKTGKITGVSVPRRNKDNPLIQNVIMVDEASMINTQLWRDLMDAMPPGSVVRCFGDVNQLPPIENDNYAARDQPSPFMTVLKNFPSVTLTNIYRQGEGSGIVKNGHRILQGMMPVPADDFKMKWTTELQPNDPVSQVLRLVAEGSIDFKSLDNQIITPINKSWIGQYELNLRIQQEIQKDEMFNAIVLPRSRWEHDKTCMIVPTDKVIWKKNDYQLEVYNGETGTIVDIVNDVINIDFGDRILGIPPWVEYIGPDGDTIGYDPRVQIELAYAVTTHKSQGSEYANSVYVLNRSSYSMHCRNNFYTAISRAKRCAYVISDQRSISQSVSQKEPPINKFIKGAKK
jgi:exodeoxyribonuclease V alpha subunit